MKAILVSLVFMVLGGAISQAASTMVVTYEAAAVMSSPVSSSYSYNFNSIGTGTKANVSWTGWGGTGTFSSMEIKSADQYGGAGNSNYTFANDSVPTTLSLSTGVSYFGMWWSAGDGGNVLDFYSGATKIFTFTSSVMNGLGSAYNGNPNAGGNFGANSGQKYAFINFFIQSGAQIDKIVARGSNFESDNWTLRDPAYGLLPADAPILPGTPAAQYNVDNSGVQTTITDPTKIDMSSVPEPSVGSLLLLGAAWALGKRRRT